MDKFAGLTHYVGALIGDGRLPRMRVALLVPGKRNPTYSANPAYAAALTGHVLPRLRELFATARLPVLSGQSLGGLAALHAAWTAPGVFGGLLLQSGSFFTPDLDPQESGYEHFKEVTGFVRSVLAATVRRPGRAADDPHLRHRRGEPRQQPADGRPPDRHRRRRRVG